MFTNLRERITRNRADREFERQQAALCDTNLARLKATDPDAAHIFTVTFTQADHDPAAKNQLAEQIRAYAAAKHAAGRLDFYNQLFAGI